MGRPPRETGLTGCIDGCIEDPLDDLADEDDIDPERLAVCSYWRCGELFERRSVHHIYCRKACRSRQKKWLRAQRRRAARSARGSSNEG